MFALPSNCYSTLVTAVCIFILSFFLSSQLPFFFFSRERIYFMDNLTHSTWTSCFLEFLVPFWRVIFWCKRDPHEKQMGQEESAWEYATSDVLGAVFAEQEKEMHDLFSSFFFFPVYPSRNLLKEVFPAQHVSRVNPWSQKCLHFFLFLHPSLTWLWLLLNLTDLMMNLE